MAIDSRDKRASVIGLGLAAQLVLPATGADLAALATRQHLAGLYALAGTPAVDVPDGVATFAFAPMDRTFTWEPGP